MADKKQNSAKAATRQPAGKAKRPVAAAKPASKPTAPKAAPKAAAKPVPKAAVKPAAKAVEKKVAPKPVAKTATKVVAKAAPAAAAPKAVAKPAAKPAPVKPAAPAKASVAAPAKPAVAAKAAAAAPGKKPVAAPAPVAAKAPAAVKPAAAAPAAAKPAMPGALKPGAARPGAVPAGALPPRPAQPAQAAKTMPANVAKPGVVRAPAPGAAVKPGVPMTPRDVAQKAADARQAMAAAAPAAPQAPKKPVSQRHGFKCNEFIVYPAHGVGRIVGIEEQEIAGMALELFVITFDKDKLTLRVPTGKLASVGMRKLSDEGVVKKAMETLKGRARIKRTMWSRRAQEYEAKINSGDLVSIAEVVRDLYRSEAQPEQSYSERQLYEAALDRMAREIAAVDHVDERGAVQRITDVLSKSAKGRRLAAEGGEDTAGEDDLKANAA